MNCPNCGFDSPPEMFYCGACGTRLRVACAECGFANPLAYHFCGMCGARLNVESASVPAVQQLPLPGTEDESLIPANLPPLGGERRVVSVIITDLTDSTHLLEQVGTEGWVELMNHILHILESEIARFGGEVSQFRGDGLVAFFGATAAHEDDPERAVLAAQSMQTAFKRYVHELARQETIDLKMRIGVNTGEVIVASMGGRQQWEETAMGVAVTIAARMETAAEPGTVLVSDNTHRLLETHFVWQALGEISVKGVSRPIMVYRPLAHVADSESASQVQSFPFSIPRIGRAEEFHTIKKCIEGLFEGRGRIVVLTGEKGSGKSFLMGEVHQYFAHRASLLAESQKAAAGPAAELVWVRGRCRSYSQTWPYSIWQDMFRDWLGLRTDATKDEKRACLREHAERLWGDEVDDHYPYLATFLGLPLEETFTDKVRHLNSEGLRQRFFLTVRSWIEAASRKGPLVLTFSDMQWADDSSLALLKYCLPVCDNEALLCLLTYRPERDAPIFEFQYYLESEYPHRLTSLHLLPLTEAQSMELITQMIGPDILPPETCSLIVNAAGGNPYYILELMRELIAKNVLVRTDETAPWTLTRTVTTLDLPDSLQRLLLTHIDRLSAQERLLFQVAAVIGPVFWFNMLQAILGETPTLRRDLAALQRRQLIQESGRVPELGMQYTFKSPLIRDTAYESLLNAQRINYHRKAAEYLEGLTRPDELSGIEGMLAYHHHGAGDRKKELFYTVLAAEQARKLYANTEALQHYNHAMELLEQLQQENKSDEQRRSIMTQRFEVLNGRRGVLVRLGKIEAALADTRALLPLARQMPDDPAWTIDALLAQADTLTDNRQDLVPGLAMVEEALALSQQAGDQQRELYSIIRLANFRFILRNPTWQDLAEKALALARQLGDLKVEVGLLLSLGDAFGMDDLPRSREYLEAALARSEKLNDKATEIELLNALGQQHEREGDYYCQLTEFEQKRLRLSREIGNFSAEGHALMFCGQILGLYLGDYEAGLELEKQTLRRWESFTDRLFPLLRIAQIQTALGRYEDALVTLDLANPLGEKVIFEIGRAGLSLVTVILYNALGDVQHLLPALEIISKAQQMATDNLVSQQYRMAAACEASEIHLKLAQILSKKGAPEGAQHLGPALEASQVALDLYLRFGFVQIVECTSEEILYRHSQALAANGRVTESAEFLKRAYAEMMRKHDLIPTDSPFRKTFLENILLHRGIRAAYSERSQSLGFRHSH